MVFEEEVNTEPSDHWPSVHLRVVPRVLPVMGRGRHTLVAVFFLAWSLTSFFKNDSEN